MKALGRVECVAQLNFYASARDPCSLHSHGALHVSLNTAFNDSLQYSSWQHVPDNTLSKPGLLGNAVLQSAVLLLESDVVVVAVSRGDTGTSERQHGSVGNPSRATAHWVLSARSVPRVKLTRTLLGTAASGRWQEMCGRDR